MSTASESPQPEQPAQAVLSQEVAVSPAPVIAEKKAPIAVGDQGLVLTTLDDMFRFSKAVYASGLAPETLDSPEKILIAVQLGAEIGLSPMIAVQNIAVIGKRPGVWGDVMLGIPRSRGLIDSIIEEQIGSEADDTLGYRCTIKRKGVERPFIHTFTKADAKKAGLWTKAGPWTNYPKRMLQMRARSWAVRDAFPDVLKGLLTVEELRDNPPSEPKVVKPLSEELS